MTWINSSVAKIVCNLLFKNRTSFKQELRNKNATETPSKQNILKEIQNKIANKQNAGR